MSGVLYMKSYLGPCIKCITSEEGNQILQDIYGGICGAHIRSRMLARKVLLLEYFWSTMQQDSQTLVRSCPSCQFHATEHRQSTNQMVLIFFPWLFEQWGINVIGPFSRSLKDINL